MVDRFRHLFDSLTEEVAVVDRDLRISYANPAWLRRVGLSPSETLGRRCHDVLLASSTPCATETCAVRQVFDSGQAMRLVCQGLQAAGSGWGELSASPVFGPSGHVTEVVQLFHPSSLSAAAREPDRDHVAVVIENARLLEAERQRVAHLGLIGAISQHILSILDPAALLDYTVQAIQDDFGYYFVDVFLTDPAGEYQVFQASSSVEHASIWLGENLRFRIGQEGIIGHVAATGKAYLSNDVDEDPFYVVDPILTATKSELAVPIKVGERVLGVLDLNSDQPDAFSEDDLFVAENLAVHLALGLENARLYAAAGQRVAELEALRQAGLSLTASLDLPTVLEAILRSAVNLQRGVQDAHVFLYQDEQIVFGAALWADGHTGQPWAEPRPHGLTYSVARQGQPIFVADMGTDPLYADAPDDWQGAIVGLPLKIGARVVGVMNVAYNQPRTWAQTELRALQLLADQAAIAIENARLYAETQKRLSELRLLFDTSAAISTSLDPDNVVEATARQITTCLGIDGCAVSIWDQEQDCLVTYLDYSEDLETWQPKPRGTLYPLAAYPLSRWVLTNRQPLAVQESSAEADPAELSWMTEEGVRSLLMIPMVVRDNVVGLLELMECRREREFAPTEVSLCQTLANQAATVWQNARLFQETEARAREMTALAAVGQAVTTLELDDVLPSIAENARQAVQAEIGSVYLWDEAQKLLLPRAFQSIGFEGLELTPFRLGEGTIGLVAESGQALIVQDPKTDPAFVPKSKAVDHIRNTLTVPLAVKGQVIGTLEVCNRSEGNRFTAADQHLLTAFAAQAAIAIENARLYQEVSQHLEDALILNRVAAAATSTLDFDEAIRRGLSALVGTRNFERAHVMLVDPSSGDLWLHPALVGSGLMTPSGHLGLPTGMGITGWVAQTGNPLRIGDVRQEPRYVAGYRDTLSELCVPLRVGDHTIGVLDAQSTRLNAFSESDERLLATMAAQLSTVIENSRLFVEANQRLRETTALMQVSQAVNEARDLQAILDIVLEEAATHLDSQEGSILLIDPPGSGRLSMVAQRGLGPEAMEDFNKRPVYSHEGIYKRALRSGHIVEVPDTAAHSDFLHKVGSAARTVTNVPLMTEKGAIGLLALEGLPKDDNMRRLLAALAGMAAVAIDKERLHQETSARLAEVSTLYTLSTQITSSLSLNSVLNSIVSILKLTLDCRACSIFLVDSTGERLRLEAASGPSSTWKGVAELRVGEGVSGRVIAEQRSIYVPDTRLEPDFLFFDPGLRSLLVVPLIVRDRIIGTLSIDDTRPNAFDDEVRLLTIAAAQASGAIENAQLYESLQTSYADLERTYDELRELDRMKSELVQNVSHELRTPLTFIKGYVELLLDGEMGEVTQDQQMALDIVANKAEVLSRLVDDIISMQQAGQEQVAFDILSLADVGHSSVRAAQASALEAGISLHDEIPEGMPPVLGDRQRLGQVFDNLVQNAIKFSRPGGMITVRMRVQGAMLHTEVEDTGIGIPADQLSRIFERFYQVDGTTTRRRGGAGLGLAIVKQIIEAHNGQVGVESTLGEGSLFYFTIPIARHDET